MKDLRITLVQNRPDQLFHSGSSVTGCLLVDVDEPKSYKHISIQFLGKAYVHWTETTREGAGDTRSTRIVQYSSSEVYVDEVQTLWTAEQSLDGSLPPGQHSFPFHFDIPPTEQSLDGSLPPGQHSFPFHIDICRAPAGALQISLPLRRLHSKALSDQSDTNCTERLGRVS